MTGAVPPDTARSRPDAQVVIVGAGPAGLACAIALAVADPAIVERLVVLDSSGRWLQRWNTRMARQGIEHLRSPITHHPHPDPWALLRHATREGMPDIVRDGHHLPRTDTFAHFAETVVAEHDLVRSVVNAAATDIATAEDGVVVKMMNGSDLRCRHLIVATGMGARRREPELPMDPRVLHAEDVDLRSPPPPGTRVLVLGGGLSAAHLALGAHAAGLRVTVALRSHFRVRHFDTVPGWMGPRYLDGFAAETDGARRRQLVSQAGGGGSMPPWARRSLAALEQQRAIEILRDSPANGCVARPEGLCVRLGSVEREVDTVWAATGFESDVRADPLLAKLAVRHPIPIHTGIPDLDKHLAWGGTRVHLVGGPAALVLGPTAGNLHGQRRGAHRVAKAVVPHYSPVGEAARHLH